jgi:hypothetical protein
MVSAQIAGQLRFYRTTPTNSKVFLFGNTTSSLGPSGSSEGAVASTPEKWTFIPVQSADHKVLRVNDKLTLTFEANASATTDASDSEFVIPISLQDGSIQVLNGPDSVVDWDVKQLGDIAFVGGVETLICEKTVRQPFALGSNVAKAFASIENNS